MSFNTRTIASDWTSAFALALGNADVTSLTLLFLHDGWLRDLLAFTWDFRSLSGRDKITSYLEHTLAPAQITDVELDTTSELAPRLITVPQLGNAEAVQVVFTFQCARGPGRALANLLRDTDGDWKAIAVFFELLELRGYEEGDTLPCRDELKVNAGRDMSHDFAEYVKRVEEHPYALIVGCGQTGLNVAARFKQMNIPTLVIERNDRVGDVWRKRYPSLTLHTVNKHHSMMYQPFPSNWPEYTPRDKLADWLETYALNQDLVVWTKSTLLPQPKYNPETLDWDVTVLRDGVPVRLRPAHIILATGTLGAPFIPSIPDQELFGGQVMHSGVYAGGAQFVGKRAVVVGAGNSSIDVCQDLVLQGAAEVTMIQRSATCVTARDLVTAKQRLIFSKDVSQDTADLRSAGWPLGLLKQLAIANQDAAWEEERVLHDKLRRGGVKLWMGPEGEGQHLLVYGRLGGYWMDKGGADLIEEGKIKVRSGVEPKIFTQDGLVLNDGSKLLADVIIFATGYLNMREANANLFGRHVIDKTDEVWGLDDEGEIKGSYRPSGYPGLWFASGDFFMSRTLSKLMAIQLKAIQAGLLQYDGRRPESQLSDEKQ